MALAHSPSIVRNGLVFYYDMNNTQKSWRGKPTTNLLTHTNSFNGGSWGGYCGSLTNATYNTTEVIAPDSTYTALKLVRDSNTSCGASSAWGMLWGAGNVTAGLTYTISMWVRSPSPINGCLFGFNDNFGGTFNITNQWTRVSFTSVMSDPGNGLRGFQFVMPAGSGTAYFWGAQLEVGNFTTPYVAGSRSSTQSLLDLTGNNTITANSLTYNDNGTFSFNGTTDYTRCTTNCNLTNDITLSAWIKNTYSGSGPHKTVICTDINYRYGVKLMTYKNYPRYGLWLGFNTSDYEALTVVDINDNVNKMLTGSWNQSTGVVKLYVNGTLTTTINTGQTSSIALADGVITTGAEYHSLGNNGFDGSIYNAQIYNRVLSDTEVLQNFNAHRDRYGI